jgi:alpha-tubulin suppressor-like RCC1 family protein
VRVAAIASFETLSRSLTRHSGVAFRACFVTLLCCVLTACDETEEPNTTCVGPRCGRAKGSSQTAEENDAGEAPPVTKTCTDDAECQNPEFCDGSEVCLNGTCAPGHPPCGSLTCHEAQRRCDCHLDDDGVLAWFCDGKDDDADGDGVAAMELGGLDCDDHDPTAFTGNLEVCDYKGHDEDCRSDTVGSTQAEGDPLGDRDDDGYIDVRCINVDRQSGEVRHALLADCDDTIDEVHPGPDSQDICDDVDNDCDGLVDELAGSGVDRSAQRQYCRDGDGDEQGRHDDPIRACGAPVGYVPCRFDLAPDCDDDERRAYTGNFELCDGLDNDCDGIVDASPSPNQALVDQPTFDDATVTVCTAGRWRIASCPPDRIWCDQTTALRGCETDATRLTSCRACESGCHFACGAQGCDEIATVVSGGDHSCAVTQEGRVACWGRGSDGRIGDDDSRSALLPRAVLGLEHVSAIAAGNAHTCAITGDEHAVYCWGSNSHGQLASFDAADSATVPVAVVGFETNRLQDAARIAAGDQHSCAVMASGKLLCWGETANGRLGDRTIESGQGFPRYAVREQIVNDVAGYYDVTDVADVGLGYQHSCLLTRAGLVECWGDNSVGQLGNNTSVASADHPMPVPSLGRVEQLAVGGYHTCVLASGTVQCWGDNSSLQLGRTSGDDDDIPKPVASLSDLVEVAAGYSFTCVRTKQGDVMCWGSNASGEAGAASELMSETPGKLSLANVSKLALGVHGCALRENATVGCWGKNVFGQLGNGTTSLDPQPIPTSIGSLTGSHR